MPTSPAPSTSPAAAPGPAAPASHPAARTPPVPRTAPATPTLTDRLRTAMIAGDERELAALLHPRAHWPGPGGITHQGCAEVLRHYGEIRARTRGVAVVETFTYPGAVILGLELTPAPAGGSGAEIVYRVFTHAEGRVTAIRDHTDRTRALTSALDAGYDPRPPSVPATATAAPPPEPAPGPAPEPAAAPAPGAGPDAAAEPAATPEGGEPACFLHRLCPECDAVLDAPPPATCWRCGTELRPAREPEPPTET